MEKVLFLDKDLYPDHKNIVDLLRKNNKDVCVGGIEKWDDFKSEDVKLFSYYPEVIDKYLDQYPEKDYKLYFDQLTKSEFSDFRSKFNEINKELVAPKLKFKKDQKLDPIELMKLFECSPVRCVKYQATGQTGKVFEYQGWETFELLSQLDSGILTPATELEKDFAQGNPAINKDMFIQFYQKNPGDLDKYQKITTVTEKTNNKEGLIWYDKKEDVLPEDIVDIPEGYNFNFYIYMKKLDTYYVSTIKQGVHPLINIENIIL